LLNEFNGGPPEEPEDWIAYLDSKLSNQRGVAQRYANYYDTKNSSLPYAQERFKEAFGDMFQGWTVNFCPLIVDSISERLRVTGFRMDDDPEPNSDAWKIWQENFMDADSNAVHIDALALGSSYVTVWKNPKTGRPLMTPESAMDVYVQYEPGSRRNVSAALKRYRDDWGTEYATLWTPDDVFTSKANRMTASNRLRWEEAKREDNPLGVVPVVPFMNRTRLRSEPFSELEPIIPLADAITKISADALVASEYAAHPQKYIAGMEVELDEDGKAKSPFQIAIDRLLLAEDPNTVFGQFAAADLGNYVKLIDNYIASIAAITRIPFHYFLIGRNGQPPSGDAITSAEAGLVAKAKERHLPFGESWEQTMRLGFKVLGDSRADDFSAEVIWADPEYRSQSAQVDSAVKLAAGLQVPLPQLWEDVGYSPQQIERFDDLRETDRELAKEAAQIQIDTATAIAAAQPDPTAPSGGKSNTPKNNTSAKKPAKAA
jgi:hypothetical protein